MRHPHPVPQKYPSLEVCVTEEMITATPLAQSTVSLRLKALRETGLVNVLPPRKNRRIRALRHGGNSPRPPP